jgi:hypothetical protein
VLSPWNISVAHLRLPARAKRVSSSKPGKTRGEITDIYVVQRRSILCAIIKRGKDQNAVTAYSTDRPIQHRWLGCDYFPPYAACRAGLRMIARANRSTSGVTPATPTSVGMAQPATTFTSKIGIAREFS